MSTGGGFPQRASGLAAAHSARIESCLHTRIVISVMRPVLMCDLLQLCCAAGCLSALSPHLPPLHRLGTDVRAFSVFLKPSQGQARPSNELKHAAVSLSVQTPPYYMSGRGNRMSEVVPVTWRRWPETPRLPGGEAASMFRQRYRVAPAIPGGVCGWSLLLLRGGSLRWERR